MSVPLERLYSALQPPVYRLVVYGDIVAVIVDNVDVDERAVDELYCVESLGEKHCYGELEDILVFVTGRRLVAFTEAWW